MLTLPAPTRMPKRHLPATLTIRNLTSGGTTVPAGTSGGASCMASSRVNETGRPTRRAGTDQTVQRILQVSSGLFRDRGFHGTSMGDIAKAVGFSAPALYHHFKNKEEILFQVCESFMLIMLARTADAVRDKTTPVLQLQAFAREQTLVHLEHLSDALQFGTGTFSLEQMSIHLQGRHARHIEALQHNLYRNLRDIIDEGSRSGDFDPVDTAAATFAVFGMVERTVYWYRPTETLSPSDLGDVHGALAVRIVTGIAS